ncbi:hypothetical protein [Sphingomonas sp. ID0503]|uniref:hypothetical protein n=1 Tax=Sphingomonas sp. ID0503 TaxID=3399691 RepID=UPI003AFAA4E3
MAYIDFTAFSLDARTVAVEASASALSPLEWTTVALARNDSLSSLTEPSRLARALGGLFGLGSQSRLADPRLEALRRLAVNAWHHGYTLPVSEIKAFVTAGFTIGQLEAVLASVGKARNDSGDRRKR